MENQYEKEPRAGKSDEKGPWSENRDEKRLRADEEDEKETIKVLQYGHIVVSITTAVLPLL